MWAGAMNEDKCIRVLEGNPLVKARLSWKDNIKWITSRKGVWKEFISPRI
jgi:hypothetical protein